MNYIIRNLHFIVIHVPIAMLIFSFLFDLAALIWKKKEWHSAGLLCLVVGTLGAIAAVLTGPDGERNPILPQHELFGKLTMVLFIVLAGIRLWLIFKKKVDIGNKKGYLAAALAGVLLVSYTGHLGGQMVHPDRKSPQGQLQRGENRSPDRQFNKQQNNKQQNNKQQAPAQEGSTL